LPKPIFASDINDCINNCLGLDSNTKNDLKETKPALENIFRDHRIMLVEDVEINREIVTELLETSALKIDCAENGIEALKLYEENPDVYDLILMDVQMPLMDGLEATRRIRAIETSAHHGKNRIPIIAMTANVFREDIENCRAAGMDDHLGKPLDMDIVFEKLQKYLL